MTIVKNLEKYVTQILRAAGVTLTQVRRMSSEDLASIFPSEKLRSIILSHAKAKPKASKEEPVVVPENLEEIVDEYSKAEPVAEAAATESEPTQEPVEVKEVEEAPVEEPVAEEAPVAKKYTMADIQPTLSEITLKSPTTVMKRLKELLPEEVISGVPFAELQEAITIQVNINKTK